MIRMPRQHIADSVSQRIMAVEKKFAANQVMEQGQRLEDALTTAPAADMAPIDGIEELIPARALDL